jgi:DNA-binding MarR family transcriptional regulator
VDIREEAADAAGQELAIGVVAGLERLIRLFRALAAPAELSLTAAATLSTLDRSGPCRVTILAAGEGVTQPAMTQLISRLADAGLLSRAADPGDGRAVQVGITGEGRALLARRRAARAQRLAGMLGQLSPADRAALAAALPAISALTSLQPEDRPLAAPQAP